MGTHDERNGIKVRIGDLPTAAERVSRIRNEALSAAPMIVIGPGLDWKVYEKFLGRDTRPRMLWVHCARWLAYRRARPRVGKTRNRRKAV